MVLKVITRPAEGVDEPSAPPYWRREADAFESQLLADLEGVAAPRFYGSVASADGTSVWLWLEHVREVEDRWPVTRYARAARDLGAFNGSYLAPREVPRHAWLSRGWLRWWSERTAPYVAKIVSDPTLWRLPLVERAFPVPPVDRILTLVDRAPELLRAIEALSPTLSHHDAWRTNLLAVRDRTVLLDWSFVGIGQAGVDLAILLAGSHFWLHADPSEIEEFDHETFDAYTSGMREAGARLTRDEIRFAYAAAAALYGGLTAPVWLPRWGDPTRRAWLEEKFRRPLEDAVEPYARVLNFTLGLGEEAWALLQG